MKRWRRRVPAAGFIVAMAAEAASAAQPMTLVFDAAVNDAVTGSDEFDSCTMSRKYVINSPNS